MFRAFRNVGFHGRASLRIYILDFALIEPPFSPGIKARWVARLSCVNFTKNSERRQPQF